METLKEIDYDCFLANHVKTILINFYFRQIFNDSDYYQFI
jgi:hypothetical protein